MPTAKISSTEATYGRVLADTVRTLILTLADLKPLWDGEATTSRKTALLNFTLDEGAKSYEIGVAPNSSTDQLEVSLPRSDFDVVRTLLREQPGNLFAGWREPNMPADWVRYDFVLGTSRPALVDRMWSSYFRPEESHGESAAPSSTAPVATADLSAVGLLNRLLREREHPATSDDEDYLSRRLGSLVLRSLLGDRP
jgi:hypothetical protein